MSSWVYLFSKFTSEALVFEALALCLLIAGYSAFWIVRKRRLGAIEQAVPAGLVKNYLNDLINQANTIRAQLFGLLAEAGVSVPQTPSLQGDHLAEILKLLQSQKFSAAPTTAPQAATQAISSDPELKAKLVALEAKLTEQSKSMESLMGEKQKIEKELAAARASGGAKAPSGTASNSAEAQDLRKKIQSLEEKLAEYSVIEDDLANLKKLQQENAQLKGALQGKAPAPAAAPSSPTPQSAAPTITPAPSAQPASPEPPMSEPPSAKNPEPIAGDALAQAASLTPPVISPTDSPKFEKMVDQVESKLSDPKPAEPVKAVEPAAPTVSPTPVTSTKSDEDLLSEFEKMLG